MDTKFTILNDKSEMTEDEEANEIVRRLKHGTPKYIILADKPFSLEFWIKWPPEDEKQKISQTEEISKGSGRDYESSSCSICTSLAK